MNAAGRARTIRLPPRKHLSSSSVEIDFDFVLVPLCVLVTGIAAVWQSRYGAGRFRFGLSLCAHRQRRFWL